MEGKSDELQSVDKQILESLLEDDTSKDHLWAETSKADEYLFSFKKIRLKV